MLGLFEEMWMIQSSTLLKLKSEMESLLVVDQFIMVLMLVKVTNTALKVIGSQVNWLLLILFCLNRRCPKECTALLDLILQRKLMTNYLWKDLCTTINTIRTYNLMFKFFKDLQFWKIKKKNFFLYLKKGDMETFCHFSSENILWQKVAILF